MSKNRPRLSPGFTDAPPPTDGRACDYPGCGGEGVHRAPKGRDRLHDYFWFCLDHVREYNKGWDFYAGMSEREIEENLRKDATWQRPTWPMGFWRTRERILRQHGMDDFGFGMDGGGAAGPARAPRTPEEQALALLNLEPPVDLGQIKARYRELAKIHHPDANGGDKAAEEMLKQINQAYNTLKASFRD